MIALIRDNLQAIRELCERFDVMRLDLFGSAATGHFDPARSDIDFLVDMGPLDQKPTWHFIDLMLELEALLGYPVQLVDLHRLRNKQLLASISEDRVSIYEIGISRTAA
ncbi:MAG: nucleotidyltransferase domain-containing protein [Thermomicrobiales bacterium]